MCKFVKVSICQQEHAIKGHQLVATTRSGSVPFAIHTLQELTICKNSFSQHWPAHGESTEPKTGKRSTWDLLPHCSSKTRKHRKSLWLSSDNIFLSLSAASGKKIRKKLKGSKNLLRKYGIIITLSTFPSSKGFLLHQHMLRLWLWLWMWLWMWGE